MSRGLPNEGAEKDRRSWHGAAFSLEALLLLFFLVVSVTVLVQLFSTTYLRGQQAAALTPAITLASNEAEIFATEWRPSNNTEFFALRDGALVAVSENEPHEYVVTRLVDSEKTQAGTLYRATIEVARKDSIVYSLDTARYTSAQEVVNNGN